MHKAGMTRSCLAAALLLSACSAAEVAGPSDVVATEEVDLLAAITPDMAGEPPADILPYIEAYGPQLVRLSPKGDVIAYRSTDNGYRQIYTMPVEGGEATVRTEGTGVTFFKFTPDGSGIVYGQDTDGDEQEAFWLLDLETGDARKLLEATKGGFRSFGAFSGDGSMFAYTSTERNGLDYDLYVYDMATGESRLVAEGNYGQFVQAVSPDGNLIVVSTTVGEDADNLYLVNAETGERRVINEPTPRANHTDAGVTFLDSGDLVLASNAGAEYASVRYIFASNSDLTLPEPRPANADTEQLNVCGVTETYVYALNRDGFSEMQIQQYRDGEFLTLAPPELPDGVYQIDCHQGSDTVAVRVSNPQSPGEIYVFEIGESTTRKLVSATMEGLNPDRLILPESIRMTASDGVELQGLLYMPPGVEGKPPVVFDVHGGPTGQSRPGFDPTTQYLLTKGIAVFEPNVRGSTGFGRTYTTLDDQRKRLDSVRDLIDMLQSPELTSRVDTSRAAVRGGSYGGYMVNAVLAAYPDAFDAGVALFGVGDWVTALEVASPALKASDLIEYGNIEEPEWREFYTDISPIAQADNIRVPVLYSHGEMDPRIDIHETEVMVKALRENGVEAEFIRIPDEGHGWRKLRNRAFYIPLEAEFLQQHLGVE